MEAPKSHWRRSIGLFLRDPWFWGLIVVMAFLGAALGEWLPKQWSNWARLAVMFAGVTIFSTVHGQRYRNSWQGSAQRGLRRSRTIISR